MTEWQPIETAPKDGTHVLGYGPLIVSTFAGGRAGYRETEPVVKEIYPRAGIWQIGGLGHARPTHWMPLPPPPKE